MKKTISVLFLVSMLLMVLLISMMATSVNAESDITLTTPYATMKSTFISKQAGSSITVMWSRAFAKKDGKYIKASGYEVQYSEKSDFSGAKTVKKNADTYVIELPLLNTKKKFQNTNYYVRVRAYKKISGEIYYSSWRKAVSSKTIKVYTPQIKSVTAKGNVVTCKWNKGGAGYYVYINDGSKWTKKTFTTETSANFTLEYDTEYSFSVMSYEEITTDDPRGLNTTVNAVLYDKNNIKTVKTPMYTVRKPSIKAHFSESMLVTELDADGDIFYIEYSENPNFLEGKTELVCASDIKDNIYKIDGLKADTKYYIRMKASSEYKGKDYFSEYSETVNASYEAPKYTIVFDSGDGERSSVEVKRNEDYTLPENLFAREGYSFAGWTTDPEVSLDPFVLGKVMYNGTVRNLAEDSILLYACWKGNSPISAADWALQIAADDSFYYGMADDKGKVSKSGHSHCYFCKGGDKVYCCNALCAAAYQHGAGYFTKYWAGSTSPSAWEKKGFRNLGKNYDPDKIQKGDIICCWNGSKWSHIMMAASDESVALKKRLIVNARGWDKGICTQNMLNKLDNYKYYQVLRLE